MGSSRPGRVLHMSAPIPCAMQCHGLPPWRKQAGLCELHISLRTLQTLRTLAQKATSTSSQSARFFWRCKSQFCAASVYALLQPLTAFFPTLACSPSRLATPLAMHRTLSILQDRSHAFSCVLTGRCWVTLPGPRLAPSPYAVMSLSVSPPPPLLSPDRHPGAVPCR